jgi:hypothetical protein
VEVWLLPLFRIPFKEIIMRSKVAAFGKCKDILVPALYSIAVFSQGPIDFFVETGYPNVPSQGEYIPTAKLQPANNGENVQAVYGPYAVATIVEIGAGCEPVFYEVGLAPVVQLSRDSQYQATPGVLNATGALTGALILTGIVTSTTAAAVVATLDTGTVMETNSSFQIGDSFDWSAIATGAGAFTVTAAATHTLEGSGVVATVTSGRFRTRKSALNTFVTTRLS